MNRDKSAGGHIEVKCDARVSTKSLSLKYGIYQSAIMNNRV